MQIGTPCFAACTTPASNDSPSERPHSGNAEGLPLGLAVTGKRMRGSTRESLAAQRRTLVQAFPLLR